VIKIENGCLMLPGLSDMDDGKPMVRRDLQFIPFQQGGQPLVLVQDHLGLVREGRAIALPLYQFMALLDGAQDLRDLQMALMRQKGGILVGADEVKGILAQLDESYLLDSSRFRKARDSMVAEFASRKVRLPSHSGKAYPSDPEALRKRLGLVMTGYPTPALPGGKLTALVCPHIDLSAGERVYASAYQTLQTAHPSTVVVLGVGHSMGREMFSLTEKDFETPLGMAETDSEFVAELRQAGAGVVSENDFAHRSEHSIEFQILFLQHILGDAGFKIVPILCGSAQGCLQEYSRQSYREAVGSFLAKLREMLSKRDREVLLLAGVDFCHVGPKFGHEMSAAYLESQAKNHDRTLLEHLTRLDADGFWETSRSVNDRYNVCGFSALACLLEVVPPCRGVVLNYDMWHEAQTQSAVSFAAAAFFS
jgi:AmmeMemoRadiSam system protein B